MIRSRCPWIEEGTVATVPSITYAAYLGKGSLYCFEFGGVFPGAFGDSMGI
jgi:hypothetical protein